MNNFWAERTFACRILAAWTAVGVLLVGNAMATDGMHFDGSGREQPWDNCTLCHGADLLGSVGPACVECHNAFSAPDAPPPGHHFPGREDPIGNNCTMCHGSDLMGDIGPSCFTCHGEVWGGSENSPPVVDPGGPYSAAPGQTIVFDASGTTDTDGDTLIYLWNFGDGSQPPFPSQNPTIQHAYAEAGTYNAVLSVTDGVNLPGIEQFTVVIGDITSNLPPVVNAGGPYLGFAGEPVQFDGSGTVDPDGDTLEYEWDFGDGSAPETSALPTAGHTYASAGTYMAILTVSDGVNDPVSEFVDVDVSPPNLPPVPDAGGPYSGIAGLAVQFDASGTVDPEGDTLTFEWDFGDGSPAGSGVAPTHTYQNQGLYTVTVMVSDGINDPVSDDVTIDIAPPNMPPLADAGGPYSGDVDTPVQFDGSGSFDADGDTLQYEWDFGDGSAPQAGVMASHTYTAAGTYNVVLTVSDGVNLPVDDSVAIVVTGTVEPPAGDAWEIRLPLVDCEGTLVFDEFAGFLFVEESFECGKVNGIGFQMNDFLFWMDARGALFMGTQDENGMMGLVFSFFGKHDTIWFAEPLNGGAGTDGALSELLGKLMQ